MSGLVVEVELDSLSTALHPEQNVIAIEAVVVDVDASVGVPGPEGPSGPPGPPGAEGPEGPVAPNQLPDVLASQLVNSPDFVVIFDNATS